MIVYGKNSVAELIRNSPQEIKKIMVSENFDVSSDPRMNASIKKFRIKLSQLPKNAITGICKSPNHQGIAAEISDFAYSSVADMLEVAGKRQEKVFLLILDHVEDPQNLGAIIRTADFLGVHGIVIPADRACDVNPTVMKVSSGASANIRIAQETNLGRVIDSLKKKGVWIAGADADSKDEVCSCDFASLDIAVVIGNEGKGMRSKTKQRCDFLLSIPREGKVQSLNASVAAGIFLYEVYRQRHATKAL